MDVGYIRISSEGQNLDRQLDGLALERIFSDKASGKNTDRVGLQECLSFLREGDVLHVHDLSRLARSLLDLEKIVMTLNSKGVTVVFHQENLTFVAGHEIDPMSKLLFQVLGSFAEFERRLIKARQREGIELAKQRGVYKGRKHCLTPEQIEDIKRSIESGRKVAELAKEYGCSRETIYALVRKPKINGTAETN